VDEQILHALAPCPIIVKVKGLDVDALVRSHAALFAAPAMPSDLTVSAVLPPLLSEEQQQLNEEPNPTQKSVGAQRRSDAA